MGKKNTRPKEPGIGQILFQGSFFLKASGLGAGGTFLRFAAAFFFETTLGAAPVSHVITPLGDVFVIPNCDKFGQYLPFIISPVKFTVNLPIHIS